MQWFPGHMAKALREFKEILPKVDIVFELRDARIPLASSNPSVHKIIGTKPCLILLNKWDLADEKIGNTWLKILQKPTSKVLPLNSKLGKGIGRIFSSSFSLLEETFAKRRKKGINLKNIRAIVIGIPNVGKSTLINKLAKKQVARVGNRPGITRGKQWVRAGNIELLDTPGVLWPKIDDKRTAMFLSLSGAIKDEVLPLLDIALYGINFLCENYPLFLKEKYSLESLSLDARENLEKIGFRLKTFAKGGRIDLEKAAKIFLHDLRNGVLGRITFEKPTDVLV